MVEAVIMPKLEMDMEDALIIAWHKGEGDEVVVGEVLFEIETSKAVLEVEAECDGILLKIVEPVDATVTVTKTVAWIGAEGEEIPEELECSEAVEESASDKATPETLTGEVRKTAGVAGKIPATPAAKRLAAENNINLADVVASGASGECRKRDVEAVLGADSTTRRVKLSPIRKQIAAKMVESGCHVPQATVEIKVDVTDLFRVRKETNERCGTKLTLTDYIAVATARALDEHPVCNARFAGDAIVYNDSVHLGIAVATDRGLIVPVVRDAEKLGIEGLSTEIRRLATAARESQLLPSEFTGSTFTISNLGMFGITSFISILNTPEAALLGVCAAEEYPVLENGSLVNRLRMNLSLTFDHRVLDGAVAAMFLSTVKKYLEEPDQLIEQ